MFGEKKKEKSQQKRAPQDYDKKQERIEKKKAWDSFVEQMKKDPELEKEFVFRKMGITPPKQTDPSERKKQELRNALMDEAIKQISEDPELKKMCTESMINEVIGGKRPIRRGGNGDSDESLYMEPSSGIERALSEIEGLAELKVKLAELGLGDNSKKGFFDGLTLKDILGVVAMFRGGMGGVAVDEQHRLPPESYYIVQINGKQTRVNESTYQRLLNEGKIRPIAAELESPKEKVEVTAEEQGSPADEAICPVVSSADEGEDFGFNLPSLDEILQFVDMKTIESYIYTNPDEIVDMLKKEVDKSNEVAQFVWGILSNTTYEGIMTLLNQYKSDERTKQLFEELEGNAGKEWINMILEKVKEKIDAKQ